MEMIFQGGTLPYIDREIGELRQCSQGPSTKFYARVELLATAHNL
jgi:hypothetical protein